MRNVVIAAVILAILSVAALIQQCSDGPAPAAPPAARVPPPPAPPPPPPEDPEYVAATDRYAIQLGMSGAALRARYQELSTECRTPPARLFTIHRKYADSIYDPKAALADLPALCAKALSTP